MATVTSYLVVSDPEVIDDVSAHAVVDEYDLELYDTTRGGADERPSVTLCREEALEDRPELEGAARALSEAFPAATVLLCDIEERFDQIERLHTKLYRKGKEAGNVEHGYIFNIGGN